MMAAPEPANAARGRCEYCDVRIGGSDVAAVAARMAEHLQGHAPERPAEEEQGRHGTLSGLAGALLGPAYHCEDAPPTAATWPRGCIEVLTPLTYEIGTAVRVELWHDGSNWRVSDGARGLRAVDFITRDVGGRRPIAEDVRELVERLGAEISDRNSHISTIAASDKDLGEAARRVAVASWATVRAGATATTSSTEGRG